MAVLGASDLDVFPLCLGGNVFGWTASRDDSFGVLDGYLAGGGNFVDTADVYSVWHDKTGGTSERIIGEWMGARGNRDRVVLATKVAKLPTRPGLAPDNVRAACDESLARLQTDRIDLYWAHEDDESVPLEDALGALEGLVDAGKVRWIGLSQYTAERLEEAMQVAAREGFRHIVALQPYYNLLAREYEDTLAPVAARHGLGVTPFFALARGFLTGKYREGGPAVDSPRAKANEEFANARGWRALAALDEIAAAHAAPVAAVALAWLRQQPTVTAPIASARNVQQLAEILPSAGLELIAAELDALAAASA